MHIVLDELACLRWDSIHELRFFCASELEREREREREKGGGGGLAGGVEESEATQPREKEKENERVGGKENERGNAIDETLHPPPF